MFLRIRHPKTPPADRYMGPCCARLKDYDAMRKHLDLALTEPRKLEPPIYELRP